MHQSHPHKCGARHGKSGPVLPETILQSECLSRQVDKRRRPFFRCVQAATDRKDRGSRVPTHSFQCSALPTTARLKRELIETAGLLIDAQLASKPSKWRSCALRHSLVRRDRISLPGQPTLARRDRAIAGFWVRQTKRRIGPSCGVVSAPRSSQALSLALKGTYRPEVHLVSLPILASH